MSSAASFLHPNEENRWRDFRFPLRQRSYLLGRRAAKAALGACFPHSPPTEIEISNGVFNQPFIKGEPQVSAEISLAHSRDAAVAFVCPAGHPAGVDIELIDGEMASVAQSCFTPLEHPILDSFSLPESATCFLLWSIKEALGKALRCGLAMPFENLAVESMEVRDGGYRSLFTNYPPFMAHSWILGDHVLSLVLPKRTSLSFEPSEELVALMSAQVAANH